MEKTKEYCVEKHYVEYLLHGVSTSESSIEQIRRRNVTEVKMPSKGFAFRFFTQKDIFIDETIVHTMKHNFTGWYFQGERFSLEDVIDLVNLNEDSVQVDVLRKEGIGTLVRTRFGDFYELKPDDVIISC